MKKQLIQFAVVVALASCAVSCSEDVEQPFNTITRFHKSYSEHLAIIESMGYNIEGLIEEDDRYVVEEDICIMKSDIELIMQHESQIQTRQMRTKYRIKRGRENGIRVSTVALYNDKWKAALLEAMEHWNNVPNCNVRFSHVGDYAGEMSVHVNNTINAVADANTPSIGGFPGVQIRINRSYDNSLCKTHESKVSVMVHELGHILGLGHTPPGEDGFSYISGTPRTEWTSVMNTGSYNRPWNSYGFTPGDILAIQRLYGTPDYNLRITGPERLYPGQTATYNLTYGPVVGNYAGNFDATVWTTDEQIVSQTNTSITIRCNHAAAHRITLSASCNYNGVTMRGSMVINPVIHYCYNQTYNSVSTYAGDAIFVQNVTVRNGAILILQAPSITIEQPFTVEAGATFYMGE